MHGLSCHDLVFHRQKLKELQKQMYGHSRHLCMYGHLVWANAWAFFSKENLLSSDISYTKQMASDDTVSCSYANDIAFSSHQFLLNYRCCNVSCILNLTSDFAKLIAKNSLVMKEVGYIMSPPVTFSDISVIGINMESFSLLSNILLLRNILSSLLATVLLHSLAYFTISPRCFFPYAHPALTL